MLSWGVAGLANIDLNSSYMAKSVANADMTPRIMPPLRRDMQQQQFLNIAILLGF